MVSDAHADDTAVGQTAHVAARMEQLARPGSTLLIRATLRLAEGYVEVKPLGRVPIKGLEDRIEVFELVGRGAAHARLEAAADRGLSRFVGRDHELDLIGDRMRLAREGQGQVIAVIGEPGVGKSRLVWEIAHSHRSEGWLVLQAAALPYRRATPYAPIVELVRACLGLGQQDQARGVRERVLGKLLTLDPRLAELVAPVLDLLEVPVEDAAWRALDASERRERLLGALANLFRAESRVQPLMVVVEDLHWIDSESEAVLRHLGEAIAGDRILLLVNGRPEYGAPWAEGPRALELRLGALAASGAEELLETLLGSDPGLTELKRELDARAGGNPFFIEELVWLAEAELHAGRLEAAGEAATRALRVARVQSERGNEAWALTVLADVADRRGEVEAAAQRYREAAALAGSLAMRALAVRCHQRSATGGRS
jgi:tetratricopeptide (TPR) repeat protein